MAIYYPTDQEVLVHEGDTTPCDGLTDLVKQRRPSVSEARKSPTGGQKLLCTRTNKQLMR